MSERKLVPKLLSNNDKGFILTRNTEGYADTDCFNAFDRDPSTSWLNTRTDYNAGGLNIEQSVSSGCLGWFVVKEFADALLYIN